jgi:hypothetical protein
MNTLLCFEGMLEVCQDVRVPTAPVESHPEAAGNVARDFRMMPRS